MVYKLRLDNSAVREHKNKLRNVLIRGVTVLVAVASPLLFSGITSADTGYKCGSATKSLYTHDWKMKWCFAVDWRNTLGEARFSGHIYCYKDNQPTRCYILMNNAHLEARPCYYDGCSITQDYSRDFGSVSNVYDYDFVGVWHNANVNTNTWRSRSTAMQVRFLEIGYLSQFHSGCSNWAGWDFTDSSNCSQTD